MSAHVSDLDVFRRASKLGAAARAFLLGDSEDKQVRWRMTERGYVTPDGRLTDLGRRVARAIATEGAWTDEDSRALDAAIRASRKPRPSGRYADPELADACRKILAYPLKQRMRTRGADAAMHSWPAR